MKLFSGLIAVVFLLGMCGKNAKVDLSSRSIEYQLSSNQYAVVVVIDGISKSQAKQMARQRAAEITVANSDRYFTIDREYETQVVKSEENPDQPRFYGNMYQELIIEQDFNRERLRAMSEPNTQIYPAIRIVFTSYREKPTLKRAIDACKLTNCQGLESP